jgi:Cu+-exporting ATPase
VYEILNGCDLEEYYAIEQYPGIRPKEESSHFDFLVLDDVRRQLIQFEDDRLVKTRLFIPEIHCSSCIYLLEQLHRLDPAIHSGRVNFQRRELSVTVSKDGEEDPLLRVFRLISRLGYTPMAADEKAEGELRDSRSLLVKIGITGFCFGNIMLLSIPEYISGRSTIEPQFERLFNVFIMLLIIPALYFGARDYFAAAWKNIRHGYLSVDVPIVIGITALFIRSLYEIMEVGEPGYFDSLSGFLFFLLIGKWFQSRTYEHLSFDRDFKSFLPLAVLGRVNGEFQPVPVKDLAKGDIIQLRNQEILPVNAQLLDESAEFDYSFVTGESAMVVREQDQLLFAGGRLCSPSARFMVSESVNEGYLQDLWKEQDAKFRSSKLINLVDRISRHFTLAIIVLALAGLAYWAVVSEWYKALEIFTAILIVACPCALALAAPFTYGNAGRLLSRLDVFLKNTSVIESLGRVKKVVFDKTGTLTRKNDTHIEWFGDSLSRDQQEDLARLASCSVHPLSKSLVRHFNTVAPVTDGPEISGFREEAGKGLSAAIGSRSYAMGSLEWMKENGLATDHLAIRDNGRTRVYTGSGDRCYGYFEFANSYREGILEDVSGMASDYEVSIISGDGNFEEHFLSKTLGDRVDIAFGQSPDDKRAYIDSLKDGKENVVMMLGDGINDGKALKASDIGVAITEDTGSFTPNSDVIMHANALSRLPDILQYGLDSRNVLWFCLFVSLLYNLVGLSFAFSGLLTPFVAAVLMPVSSVTVVLLATGLTAYFAKKRKIIR